MRLLRPLLVLLLALAYPVAALAADPPTLSGSVTDQVGTLTPDEGRITTAIAKLKADRNIDMYVVWINALDGENPATFIERTAAANNLVSNGRNVILLVSMGDRKDAVWSSGGTAIDSGDLDNIRINQVEPQLKAGDFVGAVEAAAKGFSAADSPAAAPQAQAPSVPFDWSPILRVMLVFAVLAGLIVFGWFVLQWVQVQRTKREAEARDAELLDKLSKKARATLISGDEKVRDAGQDLSFAEAEFGASEVAALRTSIDMSKQLMQEAFRIGQQIDDEIPESYDDKTVLFDGILQKTSQVDALIAKGTKVVTDLRAIEERVTDSVKKLTATSKARAKQVEDARVALARIQTHGASAYESVAHNIDAADKLFALADRYLGEAQTQLDEGKRPFAALSLRNAEDAVAKGKPSLSAVTKLGASLDEAEHNLDAEIAAAAAEISNADNVIHTTNIPGFDSNLRQAREALDTAKKEAGRENADFLLAYKRAAEANVYADQVLDGVREQQERERRAIEQAKATFRTADAAIQQANAYIESNRSKVGRKARNRLSEAQRQYEEAGRNNDIFARAAAAVAANQYAEEAYRVARSEVSEHDSPATSYGGYGGGSSSSSGGSYGSSSSSSSDSWGSSGGGISIGSFGGGGGGSSSGGGW